MRLLAILLGILLATSVTTEARTNTDKSSHRDKRTKKSSSNAERRAEARRSSRRHSSDRIDKRRASRAKPRKSVAVARDAREHKRSRAQSFGLPWNGYLEHPNKLKLGRGATIRRPWRAYGTRTTVDWTRRVIKETLAVHRPAHALAIGDISAEHGGRVSDHHSHQSGRDIDLGLFYKKKPPGYPNAFINGTEKNLDARAMWTMLRKFAYTAKKDGGVEVIFLDYDVQGIIYRWAKKHGVSEKRLEKVFQYPRGPAAGAIVRHYRNHANHIHVRFKCAKADTKCGG